MGSCLGHCRILKHDLRNTSLHIELLDDAWSLDDADVNTSNDAMLNILSYPKKGDQGCATPVSLDLEWENLPGMELTSYVTDVEEKEQQFTTNTLSTCSHETSNDSLEWDPVMGGMTDLMDGETDQLLREIEMLNWKVLQETQNWSS